MISVLNRSHLFSWPLRSWIIIMKYIIIYVFFKFFKIFKLLIKGVIWINTDFRINHLWTILLFYYLYFSKDSFYKSYLEHWNISLSVINFTYYSLYYFSIFMIFYSGYLIYYKNYIKNKEKNLKKIDI